MLAPLTHWALQLCGRPAYTMLTMGRDACAVGARERVKCAVRGWVLVASFSSYLKAVFTRTFRPVLVSGAHAQLSQVPVFGFLMPLVFVSSSTVSQLRPPLILLVRCGTGRRRLAACIPHLGAVTVCRRTRMRAHGVTLQRPKHSIPAAL
jgi:hypothetical protein